jgi:hypothetical protein
MPMIKAQAKLIENVRSIVDNTKQHSIRARVNRYRLK